MTFEFKWGEWKKVTSMKSKLSYHRRKSLFWLTLNSKLSCRFSILGRTKIVWMRYCLEWNGKQMNRTIWVRKSASDHLNFIGFDSIPPLTMQSHSWANIHPRKWRECQRNGLEIFWIYHAIHWLLWISFWMPFVHIGKSLCCCHPKQFIQTNEYICI